ncbi:MAG: FAD-dependent monooxygenase [Proteobacteria bacterium]|nr:FAD-dependent monooxygenase [Pseudomonadota bacterium]
MDKTDLDILIVGGGLTGAILVYALKNSGYSVLAVDSHDLNAKLDADFDARSIALAPSSVAILQNLGIWPLLSKAEPINHIHVSEQYRFGKAHLHSATNEALGYVVEMQAFNEVLIKLIDKKQLMAPAKLTYLDKTQGLVKIVKDGQELELRAKLIVAADGSDSLVRKLANLDVKVKEYKQTALVANIGLKRPHQNIAYERFTSTGPLALLPMSSDRMSLVWALDEKEAKRLTEIKEDDFLKLLQKNVGYRLGRFIKVGKRFNFPLRQMVMPKVVDWPLIFIGNAAHTLHPVAGQGFNLGLRDVAMLLQCLAEQGINENMALKYQELRAKDVKTIIRFTDSLVDIFTSRFPGLPLARNLGLMAMDNIPYLQNELKRRARGFAGHVPDLVCGIKLKKGPIHDTAS